MARIAILTGGFALVVLLLIGIASTRSSDDISGRVGTNAPEATGDTDSRSSGGALPPAVERVSPTPTDVVGPVPNITADLTADYTGTLVVDGTEIPDDQLDRVAGLGEISFRPGPGRVIEDFDAGTHTVEVVFWPTTSTRSAGAESFGWSFRVAA